MLRIAQFSVLALFFQIILIVAVSAQEETRTSMTAEQYAAEGFRDEQEKQFDKAIEAYKQAIKLNPDLAAGYHGLAVVYLNTGRVSDALEPLKSAVRLDPNNGRIHLNLGIAYAMLRRPDESLAELNAAKQFSPNDPRVIYEIGTALSNSFNRFEEALGMYNESRRLNPNNPNTYHSIGLMLMRLGRFSEAIAPFQEALRLDPKNRNAQFFLSDAYSFTGRYLDSADSFTKFLELVPNGPDALTKRSWNYLYAGNHGREAAESGNQFLKAWGWKVDSATYRALTAILGYRDAGMNDEAAQITAEALKKADQSKFSYSIVRFLAQQITADELLKLAQNNDDRTEAHTYIGFDSRLKNNLDEARTHFSWVKEYGNKRFFEYPLAVEELKRLGQK